MLFFIFLKKYTRRRIDERPDFAAWQNQISQNSSVEQENRKNSILQVEKSGFIVFLRKNQA